MSYATTDQVQSEFKDVDFADADAAITTTEVDRFLEEADAEIDINLSAVYQTPITGTQALVVVRMIAIWLTKSRVAEILRVKTGRPESDQDGEGGTAERARTMLRDLATGKLQLTDAVSSTSGGGVRSYTAENSIENVFDTTKQQW